MQVENRPHKISNRQTKARIVPTFKLNFIKEPKLETSQLLIENYLFLMKFKKIQSHLQLSITKLR